jgi:hypothetical protein
MKKLSLIWMVIGLSQSSLCQNLIGKEFLFNPTTNGISIKMAFHDSTRVCINYGYQPTALIFNSDTALFLPEEYSSFDLNNLSPNTTYFYSVHFKANLDTGFTIRPTYQFQTAKTQSLPFTFVVQADPHLDEQSDTSLYSRCLQNQLEDHPDFMVDLGDFLMTDKLKNSQGVVPFDTIPYRCKLLRSFYEKISHSIPVFIANGNHEGEAGWNLTGDDQNIAVQNTLERKKYFGNPFPNTFYQGDSIHYPFVGQRGDFYSFTWGNALFVIIDPYWNTLQKPDSLHGWYWSLGEYQYNWLRYVLETSDAKFKFVFAHQLVGGSKEGRGGTEYADLYEWGGNNLDGSFGFDLNRPGWYKPIKELLKENNVNIFFHGHDHFFGKQENDCLIYQETPQPSHPNFNNANQAADYGYFDGVILPNSGHIRVSVDSNAIRVDYVRVYKPENENANRHNKDISAFYTIQEGGCYDSLITSSMVWNAKYETELVYPNPFSEDVKIPFKLKKAGLVDLSIFDLDGKLVKNLLNHTQAMTGKSLVVWDGKNNNGNPQNYGTYIFKLLVNGNVQETGKIIYTPK